MQRFAALTSAVHKHTLSAAPSHVWLVPSGKKSNAANKLSGRLKGVCVFAVLKFEPCGLLKGLFMQMTRIYLGLLHQTVCFTTVLIRVANVSDVIMLLPWFLRLSANRSL